MRVVRSGQLTVGPAFRLRSGGHRRYRVTTEVDDFGGAADKGAGKPLDRSAETNGFGERGRRLGAQPVYVADALRIRDQPLWW